MAIHARLSPSSSRRWLNCAASVRYTEGLPNPMSDAAASGTADHFLSAEVLTGNVSDATGLLGRIVQVSASGEVSYVGAEALKGNPPFTYVVNIARIDRIDAYIKATAEIRQDALVFIEYALPLVEVTGEVGATGTADLVVYKGGTLYVVDAKFGHHAVPVESNTQLLTYAASAIAEIEGLGLPIESVELWIVQPTIREEPSVYVATIGEVYKHADRCRAVGRIIPMIDAIDVEKEVEEFLNPGEHCHTTYCPAFATCSAVKTNVIMAVDTSSDTRDAAELARLMDKVPLIRKWCTAVEDKVNALALSGEKVPGYKIVQGQQGNRKWTEEDKVEEVLRTFKVPAHISHVYALKTPPAMEKEVKAGGLPAGVWHTIEKLAGRSEGKLTVVPESDKRSAVEANAAEGFTKIDD